jgi:glycosyltransferase involved in cell wall biosynthesis
MKIAYVCNEYPPRCHGGLGIYVRSLARAVASRGHSVTVVGMSDRRSIEMDGEVRVVTLPSSRVRGIAWCANRARLLRWLNAEIRGYGLDVVEIPEYEGMLPFGLSDCAVVVRLHNSATAITTLAGRRLSPITRWCEHQTLRRNGNWSAGATHVFDLTRETFHLAPDRSVTWRVPFVHEHPVGTIALPKKFLLFAGTVRQDKGAVELARVADGVLADDPDLHLVYAGRIITEAGRSAGERIMGEIRMELRGRVHMLGGIPRGDVLAAMARASAFVFPSRLEASPMVVAEAMMSGCPVVLPNVPPFSEVIEDGVSGVLVTPGDDAALRGAIRKVLSDTALAATLAREGRNVAERAFAAETVVTQALEFYEVCRSDVAAGIRRPCK